MRTSLLLLLACLLLCGVAKAQTDDMTFNGNVYVGGTTSNGGRRLQVGTDTDNAVNVLQILTNGWDGTTGYPYAMPVLSLGRKGKNECVMAQIDAGFVYAMSPHGLSTTAVTSATKFMIDNTGRVGIGTLQPRYPLDVNGVIQIRSTHDAQGTTTHPLTTTNNGLIYTSSDSNYDPPGSGGTGQGVYAAFSMTHTLLTSHADPREIDPAANTSFADQSVVLPFSFCHKNTLLGKGQVVDMAKALAWVEKKMEAEMGGKAGQVIFTYDLPANQCLPYDQYVKTQDNAQVILVLQKLDTMPWIKVNIGANGNIPAEAFEEIPTYQTVMQKIVKPVKQIDCDARRLVTVNREVEVPVVVPTGKIKRQLRADWMLAEDGELYRKPTVKDIDLDALLKNAPQLPRWVQERIKSSQAASMDVNQLTEQIRQILASRDNAGMTKRAAQAAQ